MDSVNVTDDKNKSISLKMFLESGVIFVIAMENWSGLFQDTDNRPRQFLEKNLLFGQTGLKIAYFYERFVSYFYKGSFSEDPAVQCNMQSRIS